MKEYIITIDGGTTNTRCILWGSGQRRIDEERRAVGVRNTSIDGNNHKLKQAVRECIEQLLERNGVSYDQIHRIIGSGMITSDVGLVVVPWITAPAGVKELAANIAEISLPDICPIPICFIPGIKNGEGPFDLENIEAMDIMRGEEVESVAILDKFPPGKPMLLILPGSHNKFVSVDREGKITGCLTSISGELLASITNDTIIAKSVNREFVSPESYDREWVQKGYEIATRAGLGRACFTARILMLFYNNDPKKLANYILGATIAGDMQAVRNSTALKVDGDTLAVVGGKEPLRTAVADVLKYDGYFREVETFCPEGDIPLSARGAYIVARETGIL